MKKLKERPMPRDVVRSQMPVDVIRLWDKIETFAGVNIQIVARPGEAAACNPDATQATIFLPDPYKASIPDVVHELLHINRYWVEMVPQIAAARDQSRGNWAVGCWLDNVIEHIVIVPQMAEFGAGVDPQRDADIAKFSKDVFNNTFARKQACIAGALALENGVYTTDQAQIVKGKLKFEGMLHTRKVARTIIDAMKTDKRAATSLLCQYMGIPEHDLIQQTFDIREGKQIEKMF